MARQLGLLVAAATVLLSGLVLAEPLTAFTLIARTENARRALSSNCQTYYDHGNGRVQFIGESTERARLEHLGFEVVATEQGRPFSQMYAD